MTHVCLSGPQWVKVLWKVCDAIPIPYALKPWFSSESAAKEIHGTSTCQPSNCLFNIMCFNCPERDMHVARCDAYNIIHIQVNSKRMLLMAWRKSCSCRSCIPDMHRYFIMMAVDGLAPNRYQIIGSHHDDLLVTWTTLRKMPITWWRHQMEIFSA